MYHSDYIKNLFKGFCNTKVLWNDSLNGLQQLDNIKSSEVLFLREIPRKLRLGQLAEQFAFNQLEQLENCKMLVENLQIQKEKQTLGELDALIEFNFEFIHLEIVYKFYLYDATLGLLEIERWIGPNRNDSLLEKVRKLKTKQLPLLYASECNSTLEKLHLNSQIFQQRVLFKAQLFVPYQQSVSFNELNENCVCGFYINKTQLEDFNTCEFYIPSKLDWFLKPVNSVDWLDIDQFTTKAEKFLSQYKSPLVWINKPNKRLLKCFLVWW